MSEALFDKVIISGPDGELAEVVGGALQTTGGGGGGGGAVTVADGADVTQGALADAIGAGATNLIAAKSLALPVVWRATITPSDASSQTYSVSGVTIV